MSLDESFSLSGTDLNCQMQVLDSGTLTHNGRKVLKVSRKPNKGLEEFVSGGCQRHFGTYSARDKGFGNGQSNGQAILSACTTA